jgi:hypothetical protein
VITDELGPTDGLQDLARKFRERMNDGVSMDGHGEFRVDFYRRVVEAARAVSLSTLL